MPTKRQRLEKLMHQTPNLEYTAREFAFMHNHIVTVQEVNHFLREQQARDRVTSREVRVYSPYRQRFQMLRAFKLKAPGGSEKVEWALDIDIQI